MAENTAPAKCSEAVYEAARAAGLLIVTTGEEIAVQKFADAVRAQLITLLSDAASDIDSLLDYVGESNAIRMVGANETYGRARATLDRIAAAIASTPA